MSDSGVSRLRAVSMSSAFAARMSSTLASRASAIAASASFFTCVDACAMLLADSFAAATMRVTPRVTRGLISVVIVPLVRRPRP